MKNNEKINNEKRINEEVFKFLSVKIGFVLYILLILYLIYSMWVGSLGFKDMWMKVLFLNVGYILFLLGIVKFEMYLNNRGKDKESQSRILVDKVSED